MSSNGSTIYELDADNHIDGNWEPFLQANTDEHQNYENLKKNRFSVNCLNPMFRTRPQKCCFAWVGVDCLPAR
ncbi:hypothetical protein A3197_16360 [Candidatus Thiodiazotropha endoloripes]|nr:hypothetical protein A3197_16360 [Candidatus Thiodiazotropha endoloripes]